MLKKHAVPICIYRRLGIFRLLVEVSPITVPTVNSSLDSIEAHASSTALVLELVGLLDLY